MNTPRNNRIMGYVLQACNNLNREICEIYCNHMKCVYRFPGESEGQAHVFMYGTAADYPAVLAAVLETINSLEFDDMGRVIQRPPTD